MRRLFPGKTEREGREQLRSELISGMQALEHSLIEERAQFHTELTNRMQALEQTLIEEIRRLAAPPDFSPLRTDFINRVKAVEQGLLREIQQGYVSSGLARVPEKLDHVQGQVETLFSLVTQLSPVLASGESKPIREEIKVHIDAAIAALNALSNHLGNWLEERHRDDQQTQQAFDEAQKHFRRAMAHLSPSEQEEP